MVDRGRRRRGGVASVSSVVKSATVACKYELSANRAISVRLHGVRPSVCVCVCAHLSVVCVYK